MIDGESSVGLIVTGIGEHTSRVRQMLGHPCVQGFGVLRVFHVGDLDAFAVAVLADARAAIGFRRHSPVEGLEDAGFGAGAELQRGEQFVELVHVDAAEGQIVDGDSQVDVAHQSVDLAVEFHLVEVRTQCLALLAADLLGVFADAFE